ncbi:alpha-L-fucosidase [Puia sp. P3]|uniref:alpha-L-fucosidase n=1 Tax=Puia sp. P3 TaxID=3423952 RepID=UPI003D663C51
MFFTGTVSAQTERDRQAADEALHGWWPATMKDHDQRLAWWREARFGMFIHWGVYSRAGGEWKGHKVEGYAEHLMRKEKVSRAEYLELAHGFNPVKFNADEWVLHAKQAGMRYIIITSKHHDGFAMYDSQVSDFNIMKQTAWKKDPMAALSAACMKYGVKFGFYYSHAFDWEHPDAPGNDWEYNNPGGDKGLYGGVRWYDQHPELLDKARHYVDTKAIPQIRELIRKYHPDIFWFDTPSKLPFSENLRILRAIRETDLHVVVNGRLARDGDNNFGDYKNTADRPAEFFPVTGDWEAIPTTNESYGYHQFDSSHKPVAHFIRLLAKSASRGGNLLMNIGPRGDGTFDPKDLRILRGIGKWMDINTGSIRGTVAGPLPVQNWGVSTQKGNTLFLHVFEWPADGRLWVGGLKGPIGKAWLLSDPRRMALASTAAGGDYVIDVPRRVPDTADAVIAVELKGGGFDSVAFVAPNVPLARLLTFDARLHGSGFSFGDGKRDRFYVDGWTSKEQYLSWDFRTVAAAAYHLTIAYRAGEGCGGTYGWQVDGMQGEQKIEPGGTDDVVTVDLGRVTLGAGTHELSIKPVEITGRLLMRPLEIRLVK